MRLALVMAIVLATSAGSAFAAEPAALAKGRSRYNAGDYEGAINAAAVARRLPGSADAAALVIARAHLELYRQRALPEDLATARETLQAVHSVNLSSRDQVDLDIGLGQLLYLGEQFGAAAEMFETALTRTAVLTVTDRRHCSTGGRPRWTAKHRPGRPSDGRAPSNASRPAWRKNSGRIRRTRSR